MSNEEYDEHTTKSVGTLDYWGLRDAVGLACVSLDGCSSKLFKKGTEKKRTMSRINCEVLEAGHNVAAELASN